MIPLIAESAGQPAREELLKLHPPLTIAAPQAPAPVPFKENTKAQLALLAMLQAIALILAIRFFLFLTLVGGFTLALLAMSAQTTMSVVVLVSYALLVLLPVVYLETKNKRG